MADAFEELPSRRISRSSVHGLPSPPQTPVKSRTRTRKRKETGDTDGDEPSTVPQKRPANAKQRESEQSDADVAERPAKKKSTYVRKTKVDPHVARMNEKLGTFRSQSKPATAAAADEDDEKAGPLHGLLFDDPAGGVQPVSCSCPWTPLFTPMASPFQLIQERLFYDPWRLLIATIFLNKTRGVQARPVLFEFLKRFPTPEACVEADIEELAKLLYPLGLYNRRARSLVLFSKSYLDNFSRIQKLRASFEKRSPGAEETETSDEDEFQITKLYGIGQYGADSFHLFCEPESWRSIAVDDKELKRYVEWRRRVADD